MIHARSDYQRIQDPEQKIPDDEPVFLLRGQDFLAYEVLRFYAKKTRELIGGNEDVAKLVEQHAEKVSQWRKKKIADLPKENKK